MILDVVIEAAQSYNVVFFSERNEI